ncbi:MAG: hypothetical protein P4L82_20435 [Ancalomicrobiaceae bacterium]|nr:hypothetical protein [Ancalomicrobiaceae bacterium]
MSITTVHGGRRQSALNVIGARPLTIAFLLLTIGALTPILLVRVAPLADFVNHLSRMHVIAVAGKDPYLDAFYRIDWQVLPNLAMDLVVPMLARLSNVYVAGQMFLVAMVMLIVTGPMAISYALTRRINPWPLVGFLFLYNGVFLTGLVNYLAGVGIGMWGLAVWILLRDRHLALRMGVSALFVLALFFCHLSAVGLYGLAIGAFEVWDWYRRGRSLGWREAKDFVALAVPSLPIIPLLMMSPTWGLALDYEWSSQSKLDGLMTVIRIYSDTLDMGIMGLVGLAFAWGVQRRVIRFHPAALPYALISVVTYMVLPNVLFGSYMGDQRLAIAMVLTLIGFGRLETNDNQIRTALLVIVVGFSTIRFVDVGIHWMHLGRIYDQFRVALTHVPVGSKILVAYADEEESNESDRDALSHAACLGIIERSSLVSTAFTVKGKQVMTVRDEYRARVDTEDGFPPTVSRLLVGSESEDDGGNYWDDWEENHDFLVVLYGPEDATTPDQDELQEVASGNGFKLYKILH